jgi:hypothetical protein
MLLFPINAWSNDSELSLSLSGLTINSKTPYLDSAKLSTEFVFDDTLALGYYELSWSATRTLSMPKGKHGSLYGSLNSQNDNQSVVADPTSTTNDSEYLYKFFYHKDNSWHQIGQLFNNVYSYINPSITDSIADKSSPFNALVMCDGIGIQYGAYYYGNAGSAGGTAAMSASAVPEASTFVGLATGIALNIAGVMGYVRRRRM